MTYYPSMAYHMVSLEPPVRPPTALSGVFDAFTGALSNLFGGDAVTASLSAAQKAGYCSTANPQGSCSPVSGVCLPMDPTTYETFKNLQRQCNRMAAKEGRSLIGVDGRIGPGTVNAVASALKYATSDAASSMGLSWSDIQGKPCDLVAAHAGELAAKISSIAGSAPMVADPSTSRPSVVGAGGKMIHPSADVIRQSADTGFGALFTWIPAPVKTPIGLAALAFGGFAIWKATKKPGRRGRRSTRRRRR